MPPSRDNLQQWLKEFDFATLFNQLGWDHYTAANLTVTVQGTSLVLRPIAHKRGMIAYLFEAGAGQELPPYALRRKIDNQVRRSADEHLIVFSDRRTGHQIWQWVRREPGLPTACREQGYWMTQHGDILIEKLLGIGFSLAEEERLSITTVAARARAAFDVDRVTKRFYDRFKLEHQTFLRFVTGIQSQGDREWYVSLMLNRLMFIYFIQKKGFLDGDVDYLRHRLQMMQERAGKDKFLSFYRHFALRLFHEGLGAEPKGRSLELDSLLGKVPYINGGLFDVHKLEIENPKIEIPDQAFEAIFDFFDAYQWRLDERPLSADNEINPDVLGYIFEKYINQKQMGAYYTKEDITGYIARTTIVPAILDRVRATTRASLDEQIAGLLHEEPRRYVFQSASWGTERPLPSDIALGITDASRRTNWNKAAPADFALPSETWREYLERREAYDRLLVGIEKDEVWSSDDFVTYNIDMPLLVQDAIEHCRRPAELAACYESIRGLTVLDPTCGSGAFLFAALNLLEPLYEACLDRMQAFLDDLPADSAPDSHELESFQKILVDVAKHPNRRYFVLKSIILNNIFGVDIMEEAVEICKLRLFLKLAAQLDPAVADLEPLPDIDFNIRPGNTLVGVLSGADLTHMLASKLDLDGAGAALHAKAKSVDEAFQRFRRIQTATGSTSEDQHKAKGELRVVLDGLRNELDSYLAVDYGARKQIDEWRASHQPFHWFAEFYGIVQAGGFDVVLGNPPYVEYRKVRSTYTVKGLSTEPCGDLYAMVMERGLGLLAAGGRMGMIVPVSITGTDGFQQLRDALLHESACTHYQGYAERPSKLFTGVDKRLAIWVLRKGEAPGRVFASKYRRWLAEERDHLFQTVRFADVTEVPSLVGRALPKIQASAEESVLRKLHSSGKPLGVYMSRSSKNIVFYTRKVRYFIPFLLTVPRIKDSHGGLVPPSELKELVFPTRAERDVATAVLNSNLFFWFFCVYSDVRNVNRREIEQFRVDLSVVRPGAVQALADLVAELMDDFEKNSEMLRGDYGPHGTLEIQSFRPRLSKGIIDRIDNTLGAVYGLTPLEQDFIINHDIKYRMGSGEEDEE